jgi:hypothetical protein
MTDIQFKLLQILAVPLALFFVAQWWALPESLERGSSDTATVSAVYSSYKGGEVMLRESTGELLVVRCRQAPNLCKALEARSIPNLRVWVLRPSLLRGAILVAAEHEERVLVSEVQQSEILTEAKTFQGGLALFFSGTAGAVLFFSLRRNAAK